jgi:hypothetical protein
MNTQGAQIRKRVIRLRMRRGGKMKKAIGLALSILALASGARAQMLKRHVELKLYTGYALTSITGRLLYSNQMSSPFGIFNPISESSSVGFNSKGCVFASGGIDFFWNENFGYQLNFGYLKADLPNTTAARLSYTNTVLDASGAKDFMWSGTGTLSSIPVSLNLMVRLGTSRSWGCISAGPTLFHNTFEATSSVGRRVIASDGPVSETLDFLRIPLQIYKTPWMSVGLDFGAGFTVYLSSKVGLFAEAKYFLCPVKEFPWTILMGTYNGELGNLTGVVFDQGGIDELLRKSDFIDKINPSFFQFGLGLKIILGR